MSARNLEARVVKLETRTRRGDEMLLTWSKPNEEPQAAIDRARPLVAPGDRVMLAQWCCEDDPPSSRWHQNFPRQWDERSRGYLHRLLHEHREKPETRQEPEWMTSKAAYAMTELSDTDLWYELLKIET
jgi:hypothetical protein